MPPIASVCPLYLPRPGCHRLSTTDLLECSVQSHSLEEVRGVPRGHPASLAAECVGSSDVAYTGAPALILIRHRDDFIAAGSQQPLVWRGKCSHCGRWGDVPTWSVFQTCPHPMGDGSKCPGTLVRTLLRCARAGPFHSYDPPLYKRQ